MEAAVTGRKRLYLVGAACLVVILINLVSVSRAYGYFMLDDELGYWSNAAHLAGYDWLGVTKKINWYSYGYSLVLYVMIQLARLFGGNMTTAYRLALGCNAVMCGGVFLLCYRTIRRLTGKNEWMSLIGGAASALTIMLVFHSRMGWSECILVLLTTAVAVVALYDPQRKNMALNVLLSALVGYTYMVHNRMTGLVLAFAVYAVAVVIAGDRRLQKALTLLLPVAALLIIDSYLSRYFKVRMWGAVESPTNPHTVSMMVGKLRSVFSLRGALAFVRETIGQLWYLGVSTFGLFYMGLVHVVCGLKEGVSKRQAGQSLAWGLVLLGFVFSLGISVIYWFSFYIPENYTGRGDVYYYGRYIENWASIYVALGCCRLSRVFERRPGRVTFGLFAALQLLATASILAVPHGGMNAVNRVCAIGTLAISQYFTNNASIWTAMIVFVLVVGAFVLAVFLGRRDGQRRWMIYLPLLAVMLVSLASARKQVRTYIVDYQKTLSGVSRVLDADLKLADDESTVLLGYSDSDSPVDETGVAMKRLQFFRPRTKCVLERAEPLESYLDGRADYLVVNLTEGLRYASGTMRPYKGYCMGKASAVLFDLSDREEDREPGVAVPLDAFSAINGTVEADAICTDPGKSFIMYGPYTALDAGKYSVTIEGRLISGAFSDECYMDVALDGGARQPAVVNHLENCLTGDTFVCTCPFTLEANEAYCEFRLFTDANARVSVSRVTLLSVE